MVENQAIRLIWADSTGSFFAELFVVQVDQSSFVETQAKENIIYLL